MLHSSFIFFIAPPVPFTFHNYLAFGLRSRFHSSTMSSTPTSCLSSETLQYLITGNDVERKAAEKQLLETSLTDRVAVFVQTLMSLSASVTSGPLLHMAAVLLRRDILKLDGETDAALLQSMASPVIQAHAAMPPSTKTAVGYCLAAICQVLEASGQKDANQNGSTSSIVISQILSSVAASVSDPVHMPCPSCHVLPTKFLYLIGLRGRSGKPSASSISVERSTLIFHADGST